MNRRPPRSTHCISSAASDVYKRQYQRRVHGIIQFLVQFLFNKLQFFDFILFVGQLVIEMSSMFVWGCCAGFLIRLFSAKSALRHLTTQPWNFPKYVLGTGIGIYYVDWIRRVYLEDNCEDEEKREFYLSRTFIDSLDLGEELTEPFKGAFWMHAVKQQI
eukprot:TRINITY_DN10961_c0_g1_i1.p1 TRINITY_DN10961_c0_g1~~TRINITY_DN10961_c0_g1_i1.p1  ORF type:complete len:160 (-),score=39.34 TRINITY_DN10961_c0_g1_i1:196-675(-)